MKNLKRTAFCAFLVLSTVCCIAQNIQKRSVSVNEPDYNKPKLFGDLPDRIDFDPTHLLDLLTSQVGQSISLSVAPAMSVSGQVVSKAEDKNSTSVVVRMTNRPGARLIFTKLTDQNNAVKYIGRIISLKHGDSFEIVAENDHYYLKKKKVYDLVTE